MYSKHIIAFVAITWDAKSYYFKTFLKNSHIYTSHCTLWFKKKHLSSQFLPLYNSVFKFRRNNSELSYFNFGFNMNLCDWNE